MVRACPDTTTWTFDGTGDWMDGDNWANGCVPTETMDASINNFGKAQILRDEDHAMAKSLILGNNQGESGTLTLEGASAILDLGNSTCRGNIYIGNRGTGSLTIRGGAYIRSRYAYVGALENSTKPSSNGNVKVEGSAIWYLFDYFDPSAGCTGAGLFIGTADGNGSGGTATVDVSDGGTIAIINRGNAPGVTVGLSGTLTGNRVVQISGGTSSSKTVKVFGTLAPKAGTLTLIGNLSLDSISANTVCHVTPGAWDKVQVTETTTGTGLATLGGRVTVIMSGTFTPNTSFTLLHADAGRNNTVFDFESITYTAGPYDPCISPTITYDANNVYLTVDDC